MYIVEQTIVRLEVIAVIVQHKNMLLMIPKNVDIVEQTVVRLGVIAVIVQHKNILWLINVEVCGQVIS